MENNQNRKPYWRLAGMLAISFIAMYAIMYSTVNSASNIFLNINKFYMAILMALPMAIIGISLMGGMYPSRKKNAWIIAGSLLAMLVVFLLIRNQGAVDDRQFLRSMIPHHAGAILMCRQASYEDAEIASLCEEIIASQEREIRQMKAILERID